MSDQNLIVMNKVIELYQELASHDGYGDMEVKIRLTQGKTRAVIIRCGKEYKFEIDSQADASFRHCYKVVSYKPTSSWRGSERRSADRRGRLADRRRAQKTPRNFRLERRVARDRRSVSSRRIKLAGYK